MKSRTKPSNYSPIPFYAIRAISSISSLIVISIIAFFSRQLWADGYKIPWTFLIVLLASLVNLVVLIITGIIACCANLSPLIHILLNIPILVLWVLSISMLTWNTYGTLGHTCSLTNWGNSRGVLVCQIYKTLYSFIVFANLSHIAQIVLDIRARRQQVRRGKYDKMTDSQDIKIDDLKPLALSTMHGSPAASQTSLPTHFKDDQYQHHRQEFRDDMPGWRPGQRPTMDHAQSYTSNNSDHSNGRSMDRYHGYDSSTSVHMQDFTSHQRPQPSTHYESRNYQPSYRQQQDDYYQRRY